HGDPAPLLIRIVVRDGVAVLDGAHPCDAAGREEHRFEERRLARPSVANEQDVSDVLRVVRIQRAPPGCARIAVAGPGRGSRHPIELEHPGVLCCSGSGFWPALTART